MGKQNHSKGGYMKELLIKLDDAVFEELKASMMTKLMGDGCFGIETELIKGIIKKIVNGETEMSVKFKKP